VARQSDSAAGEGEEEGGRDMPTRPNRCEGCPDPPSNKLPIREHDLYMLDSPIIVAFLCPDCIAVDEGDDRNAKRRLRTRVKKQREERATLKGRV
jgi:hypothetical protein